MKWVWKILNWRAAQQHLSVTALLIGAIAGIAGITLTTAQIDVLVTAGSVILYIWSQFHPKAPVK